MSMKRTLLTLGTLAVLSLAAVAVPALAKPGDGPDGGHPGPGPGDDRLNRTDRQDARESRHEAMRDAHDAWQACKRDFRDNQSLNESMQHFCMAEKGFFLNATQARRQAHAEIGAIIGLERRLGRLEERKILLEQELNDSSNLTANETADLQARIDKIQDHEVKVVAELQALRAELKALDGKWATVREHILERRHKGLDDGLEDDSGSDDAADSGDAGSASDSSSSA
jgi:hypothetical protein